MKSRVDDLIAWLMKTPVSLAYWKSIAREGDQRGYDPLRYLAARQQAAFADLSDKASLELAEWTMLAALPNGEVGA